MCSPQHTLCYAEGSQRSGWLIRPSHKHFGLGEDAFSLWFPWSPKRSGPGSLSRFSRISWVRVTESGNLGARYNSRWVFWRPPVVGPRNGQLLKLWSWTRTCCTERLVESSHHPPVRACAGRASPLRSQFPICVRRTPPPHSICG